MRHGLVAPILALLLCGCPTSAPPPPGTQPGDTAIPDAVDTATDSDAGGAADIAELPTPTLWPANELPALTGPFYDAHPEVTWVSRWRTHLDGSPEPQPPYRARGAFAVGNGRVFALIGMADPANTLHGMAGPTYELRDGFWADQSVGIETADGGATSWDEQWVMASFGAPVVIWRGVGGALEMDTVDLAPWPADGAGDRAGDVPPLHRSLLRYVLVRNTGAEPLSGLTLVVDSLRGQAADIPGAVLEERDGRVALTFLDRDGAIVDGRDLRFALPELAPGAEERLLLVRMTADADADLAAEWAALQAEDADAVLDASGAAMAAFWRRLATFRTPDPMVDDLLRALTLSLKVQLSAGGATSPMSNYAGTWTRDNAGPVLGLLASGAQEEAAGVIDYYWAAVLDAGGFQNRYRNDLDPAAVVRPEPDWASLGQGSGRVAAEAPSYIPLIYGWWTDWTGSTARADARVGMLRYALDVQRLSDDWLLSWSGDETFRAAMNSAMGLELEYPHQEETWSSNSSLLWIGAARALARLRELAGDVDEATDLRRRAAAVEQAALENLTLEDGCWAAYRFQESGEYAPGPFEDAALKELWAGVRDGDDPDALARLECLIARTGDGPGILQSPPHERFAAAPLLAVAAEGVYTGMLPGYTLVAMARAGLPEAEDAFDAVRLSADTAGVTSEYMVYSDHLPLHMLYNPYGEELIDYTARHRPWEGGIVLHGMLEYLVGLSPQAQADAFSLRPHLPNDWPAFSAQGLRVGDARFDLDVRRESAETVAVTVTSHADRPFAMSLRWDVGSARTVAAESDGHDLSVVVYAQRPDSGSVVVEDIALAPGTTHVTRFTVAP